MKVQGAIEQYIDVDTHRRKIRFVEKKLREEVQSRSDEWVWDAVVWRIVERTRHQTMREANL